ncbi:hypothetical protein CXB51_029279 [Gossypium anomalum]|uniref:non-specific serine/threonine protein kinase n=1 Tax=Gossypium anomalum TaxID=47600 RepID=A0A8J5YG51_9ROSI|nr:hypothetical protein CXB51_029279 [Gossypium anomalum]
MLLNAKDALYFSSLLGNRLTGSIPGELANLRNLTSLILENNDLFGTLPAALGNLSKIERLHLSSNKFTGEIPEVFARLTSLKELYMEGSGLSGPIPSINATLENLEYIIISDLNGAETSFPQLFINASLPKLDRLMLRSCNLIGEMPASFGTFTAIHVLDLSFNRLDGKIPEELSALALNNLFLNGNNFGGTVPSWMLNTNVKIDLSYNNFTDTDVSDCQQNSSNLFSSIARVNNTGIVPCLTSLINCTSEPLHFVHINCGGRITTVNDTTYEADYDQAGPSTFYRSTNWAFSSTGIFLSDALPDDILVLDNGQVSVDGDEEELYINARLAPSSLTYYAFCLANATYTVNLHFAEIQFTDDQTYSSLGRRIFDVYIQGKRQLKDFNIEEEAGGAGILMVKKFTVNLTDGTLEIHFRWAGKGTTSMPERSIYGPLISAISVFDPGRSNINIISFEMNTLQSKLELHFAEIQFTDDQTYSSLGRRIFDVYIQGKRQLKDFNIEEEAGGAGIPMVKKFTVNLTDGTLEIHFRWAGKGTTSMPERSIYGPLISAISVFDPALKQFVSIDLRSNINIISFEMNTLQSKLELHFAEIQFTDDQTYSSLGRRIFDVYIQIHFRWAAKGTTSMPERSIYGPLISAISVFDPALKQFVSIDLRSNINIISFEMNTLQSKLELHFAEIQFTDDQTYSSLGRRIFDVYIQGKRQLKDFNIEEEAGGAGIPMVKKFTVNLTDGTLEIHFRWAGKGTTSMPERSIYGPLISAISVFDPALKQFVSIDLRSNINIISFEMNTLQSKLELHFAEIQFTDDQTYSSLGRRIFDVYIQGKRQLKDFNIEEEAGGAGIPMVKKFTVNLTDGTLEIHFRWAGKGTTSMPERSIYGPLISAISVFDPALKQFVSIDLRSNINIISFEMNTLQSKLELHFAEIQFTDDQTYSSLGRRIFDVYIQIHFRWAGKGTTSMPERSIYGPLISAISVFDPALKQFVSIDLRSNINIISFEMNTLQSKLELHFAEIQFTDDQTYSSLGRRIFDVYIQGKRQLKDFNIEEEAGGAGIPMVKKFTVNLTDGTLEIHFRWAGKGTTSMPERSIYGPLISAISVFDPGRSNINIISFEMNTLQSKLELHFAEIQFTDDQTYSSLGRRIFDVYIQGKRQLKDFNIEEEAGGAGIPMVKKFTVNLTDGTLEIHFRWAGKGTTSMPERSIYGPLISAISVFDPALKQFVSIDLRSNINIISFEMNTLQSKLELHFAEIQFTDDQTYSSLGRRIFDVYIQGKRQLKDFNIEEEAGGAGIPMVKKFTVNLTDGTLEIHFRWAGKGTTSMPERSIYGPLISAISVFDPGRSNINIISFEMNTLQSKLELHFAEIQFTDDQTYSSLGRRIFDVYIQGKRQLKDFNIEEEAGGAGIPMSMLALKQFVSIDLRSNINIISFEMNTLQSKLELHFAEIQFTDDQTYSSLGRRIFDVYIQGKRQLKDFNIEEEAGGAGIPMSMLALKQFVSIDLRSNINIISFEMNTLQSKLELHFAEIQFTDDQTYSSLGRRIFDVYIQGKRQLKDFNIEEEAGGAGIPMVKKFIVNLTDGTLEIRFRWAGKGTTSMPERSIYGPLISAISVFDPALKQFVSIDLRSNINIISFEMNTLQSKLELHFAEIQFTDDQTYSSLGRRIFDVYIQGKRQLKDFNIEEEAGGAGIPMVKKFTVNLTDGTLEIHFRWAGKGTTSMPERSIYGPLISAISVFDPALKQFVSIDLRSNINIISFEMNTLQSKLELHFAEIQFTDDQTYSSLGRRIFDVYIQGKRQLKDFNIEEEAGGAGIPMVKKFTVNLTDGTLEIHFRWAGKGTTSMPERSIYGPLISAISVFDPGRSNINIISFEMNTLQSKLELHFAEIQFTDDQTYSSLGRRIFDVYIQGKRQLKDFNIEEEAGGAGIPMVKKFTVNLTDGTLEIHFRWAGKGTTSMPERSIYGPLISAISVFDPGYKPPSKSGGRISTATMAGIVAGATFATLLIVGIFWWNCCYKLDDEGSGVLFGDEFQNGMELRKFSLVQIAKMTNNFNGEKLVKGGFGVVYKGYLRESETYVAVKRISKASKQGIKEYASEVKIISQSRHKNLVKLIGQCHEKGELILVYELMANGSLDSHLFKGKTLLTWEVRFKIVQDLALALFYLHEEGDHCVLHRDIKASNIMLDSSFNAKLGDFGLARLVDHEKASQTTHLAGTLGYLAPECVSSGKASKESDVYSFGVVALEIACGRRSIESKYEESQVSLVAWVWDSYGSQRLLDVADPKLSMNFDAKQMECLLMIGLWCVHPDQHLRPSTRQTIQVLNFEAPLPKLPSTRPTAAYNAQITTEIHTSEPSPAVATTTHGCTSNVANIV